MRIRETEKHAKRKKKEEKKQTPCAGTHSLPIYELSKKKLNTNYSRLRHRPPSQAKRKIIKREQQTPTRQHVLELSLPVYEWSKKKYIQKRKVKKKRKEKESMGWNL